MDEVDCYGILYDENAPECQKCKIAKACRKRQLGKPEPTSPQHLLAQLEKGEGERPKQVIKVPDPEDPIWKEVRSCLKGWVTKGMILEKIPKLNREVLDMMIQRLAPALDRKAMWHIEK